jgi:CubicO group peptidase (beta-lactamase class C family)
MSETKGSAGFEQDWPGSQDSQVDRHAVPFGPLAEFERHVKFNRSQRILTVFLLRALSFAVLAWSIACAIGPTAAQSDVSPDLLNRPPVAAPTAKIETGAIPVVLSESQEADNFASGLMQGLMFDSRVKGIALVIVKGDHVMLQRNVGAVTPGTRFAADGLSEIFNAVAVMQQVERGRLMLDADVSKAIGEKDPRGMTLADVLASQSGDNSLLVRALEKSSGAGLFDYMAKEIAQPLGMTATAYRDERLETNLDDLSRLAIVLVNGGSFQSAHILMPATVDLMESTRFLTHPALPGWAYGFAEMRRNGWRALQHDGVMGDFGSRLVIAPEAKLAYLIVAEGRTDKEFWRTLDNGLFDKLLATRNTQIGGLAGTPALTEADARRVAGVYEPIRNQAAGMAGLKRGGRVNVRADGGAVLILTGAENATLTPRPGGYWTNADGNLNAVTSDGELLLSSGIYTPLAFYKRFDLYAWFALLVALLAGGLAYYEAHQASAVRFPSDTVVGLASACGVFVLLSLVAWLFGLGA